MSDDQSTAHYVEQPRYSFFIRIAQAVLALITLALTAFILSKFGDAASYYDEVIFVLFCTIFTFFVVGYLIVTPIYAPHLYNYWAQLVAEAIAVIFWFAGFIALAAWVGKSSSATANLGGFNLDDFDLGSFDLSDIIKRDDSMMSLLEKRQRRGGSSSPPPRSAPKKPSWFIAAAIASATSAILWVLFMVTFIVFIISLKKHRADPAKQHLPGSGMPYGGEKSGHEMGNVAIGQAAPVYQAGQQYPMPTQTPVYPVNPTPPPQQWQQSPPPQGHTPYGQA